MEKRLIDALSGQPDDSKPSMIDRVRQATQLDRKTSGILHAVWLLSLLTVAIWMVAHQKASHAPHNHPESAHSHDDSALRQVENRIADLAGQVSGHSAELDAIASGSSSAEIESIWTEIAVVKDRIKKLK